MKPEDLFKAIGAADDELLERSQKRKAPSKKCLELGALAACVCIVAAVAVITVKMGTSEYVNPETEETAQTSQTEQLKETGQTLPSGIGTTPQPIETSTAVSSCEASTESSDIIDPTVGSDTAPPEGEISPPKETPSPAYYDDSFVDFYVEDPKVGMPMTYDEVMNMLLSPSPGQHELDSFYLIETVRLLSPSECADVEGIYEFYGSRHSETTEAGSDITPAAYMEDDTIYEVILKKDLITGEETNERCYMLVRHMGNMDEQKKGDPLFAPGELFCAPVDYKEDGEDFRKTAGDFMLRFDVKMSQDGIYTAYFRGDEWDADALPFGENVDYTVITSTTQNPAHYTKAVTLDELTEFLIKDWSERR